jgi:phenylpyruvate tautomerase PptA (4-oxalocrotonate tautomerase family)
MPIAIQLTRGLLTPEGERSVFSRVARALLEAHGLADNDFMKENVIGHVEVLPEGTSYVGGKAQSLALIEVKVPSITFPNRDVQRAFVERVTDIVDELKAGAHPRGRTFVNVTYAVDGAWGIAGKAYSNADLAAAIGGAAAASRA